MFESICVPVDASEQSLQAVRAALRLRAGGGARLVGCHVLSGGADVGDDFVAQRFLAPAQELCADSGVELEPKVFRGRRHLELCRDIGESAYDLVVMGGAGLGGSEDLGSVVERVARGSARDLLVVKRLPEAGADHRDTILVALDGSPQSFGGLATAAELAKRFDKTIEMIAVYDPYLHYAVFSSVVDVLSEKAAKVFRFEEQNQLHEEIIDTGLAQIYQSHLDVGATLLQRRGLDGRKTLLDGKAFQKILDHVHAVDPWLLVLGRVGVHSDGDDPGLGSNTENLLRSCPCDVLLSARREVPELDLKAEEAIRWTTEAEERMARVPPLVKGIARTGILRLAVEQGHSVITNSVIDEAMDRFMPKQTARMSAELAEAIALDRAANQPTAICKACGVAASEPEPARCAVCGSSDFEVVTREMIERIASMEGGVEEETTFDGRSLKWTQQARQAVRAIPDKYQRRRSKARIEKSARARKLDTITLDFAFRVIEEETGTGLDELAGAAPQQPSPEVDDQGRRVVATDVRGNQMWSAVEWRDEALHRILRVPAGFMRTKTQERVEALAAEKGAEAVTLELVEEGIQEGRRMMAEMVRGYGEKVAAMPSREQVEAAADSCPAEAEETSPKRYEDGHWTSGDPRLNEVGSMADKAASKLRIPYDRALDDGEGS